MALGFPAQLLLGASSYFLEGISRPQRVMAINLEGVWLGCELLERWQGRAMDVMRAAADAGLIVRQERGVINRATYIISILHDPAAAASPVLLTPIGFASGASPSTADT